MKHYSGTIVVLFALLSAAYLVSCATGQSLPEGWRLPTADDYPGFLLSMHNGNPPIEVVADFDGDGEQDRAYYLISHDEDRVGLFVIWSISTGMRRIERLVEQRSGAEINWGISLMPAGTYETACGKGYYECAAGQPKEITLPYPGIGYFVIGSAGSVFYWHESGEKPTHVWLDD